MDLPRSDKSGYWRRAKERLPKPIIFGYNLLAAIETVRCFKKTLEFSFVDAIVTIGSTAKPGQNSAGKDIDMFIFLKEETSASEEARINKKFEHILEQNERKFGVSFDIMPFAHEQMVKARSPLGARALRLAKSCPNRVLYSCHESWVKKCLEGRLPKPSPRKRTRKAEKRMPIRKGRRLR